MSQIIQCSHCGAKNRLPAKASMVNARCGRCHRPFVAEFKYKDFSQNKIFWRLGRRTIPIWIWLMTWVVLGVGIIYVPELISTNPSELAAVNQERLESIQNDLNAEFLRQKQDYEEKLGEIDPFELASRAKTTYQEEFLARRSFDQRYALSQRERTQLRLQSLASDTSQTIQAVLRTVALEAAPRGSSAQVRPSEMGLVLKIEFDMGSMVAGESTARTRHQTLDSLKNEVISLISRVTNDVFLVCRDFPLNEIQVGCLRTVYTDTNHRTTEKILLYQIKISAETFNIDSNNPFLDFYATENNMIVLSDNFHTLQLIDSR